MIKIVIVLGIIIVLIFGLFLLVRKIVKHWNYKNKKKVQSKSTKKDNGKGHGLRTNFLQAVSLITVGYVGDTILTSIEENLTTVAFNDTILTARIVTASFIVVALIGVLINTMLIYVKKLDKNKLREQK